MPFQVYNGTGKVWCNDCATCASKGCEDTCGFEGIGDFFAFGGIMVLCAFLSVGLIGVALVVRSSCRPRSDAGLPQPAHPVHGRMPLVAALIMGGIPQVVTQYFSFYSLNASSSMGALQPPCIRYSSDLGLWTSGYDGIATGDFLMPCSNGSMQDIHALRGTAFTGLVCSILSCFSILAFASPIPGAATIAIHIILLVATVGQGVALGTSDNFCGSGATLEQLGYERGPAVGGQYGALALCGIGLAATGLLRFFRPDCFVTPEVAYVPIDPATAAGHYAQPAPYYAVPPPAVYGHQQPYAAPQGDGGYAEGVPVATNSGYK